MDHGFVFAADLMRQISAPTVGHLSAKMFVTWITMGTRGKSCLARNRFCAVWVKAGPGASGWQSSWTSPAKRRVAPEPDYFGFRTASNQEG